MDKGLKNLKFKLILVIIIALALLEIRMLPMMEKVTDLIVYPLAAILSLWIIAIVHDTIKFQIKKHFKTDKTALLVELLQDYWLIFPNDVRNLIRSGANPNATGNFGNLILLQAILPKRSPAVIKELILNGADWKYTTKGDETNLLICAAGFYKKTELIAFLLDLGLPINAQNNDGITPLIAAAIYNNKKVYQFLLQRGADKDLTDKSGHKAEDYLNNKPLRQNYFKPVS